ncbi:Glycosyltransferase involved in cell wall bisynthesis [Flavobacterium swingsii]|uniref:Glycosyltransferase involved in cell wall bisynthesis n=1 Tax=Flavobacterium swingsii TaxID=498292 RepID=A0A1I0Z7E2_9FLAO|nr:glycosyltransferase family 4 protein [Flavobacterium swingsii]SFB21267.1 Glycosyltransferase involved in cell wall bisynthesis [Flavobacterium swingsii]
MHICFITHEYPKTGFPHGGFGSFVKIIATALVTKGIHVSVVGINYSETNEESIENGVALYRLKKNTVKGLSWWLNSKAINAKIREIHKKKPIDIIETAELGLAFLTKIKDIQYVIRLHGGHHFFAEAENRGIDWWKGFQEKRSFAKADAFVPVSNYVKTHTEKYLSYRKKPVTTIFYPINTDLFSPLHVNVVPFQIVFAGTICEKKGIRQLIQAFSIVKEKYPEATLEIYGRDWLFPDGSSYQQMLVEKEFPKLGSYADAVRFHGAIAFESLPAKYAQASVCVFPSHMETQGLVAPEAMAMEKMVVFTKLGPGPETITDYETGLLCNPHNPEDIAEKISWVFANKEKSIEIGKRARTFVLKKYGLENSVNQNIIFFQSLLIKKR